MKRFIVVLLAVVIAAPCTFLLSGCTGGGSSFSFPSRVRTDDPEKSFAGYNYGLYDDGSAIITGYTGSERELRLPDSLDGHKVVTIGDNAFADNTALTKVSLNSSLEMLGSFAFYGCTSLTDVSFGNSLWHIGVAAFEDTPWLSSRTEEFVIVGEGILLKYSGNAHKVKIPDNVKHISYAFSMNDSVIYVEMGDNVLTVGDSAFSFCPKLREVKLGNNVLSIGNAAFENCELLARVNIPDSVLKIGDGAFNFCIFLNDIHIGSSVAEIGASAFNDCQRMKVVNLPASVKKIGGSAFANCYSLCLVCYTGSEESFNSVEMDGSSNFRLKDAKKIFSEVGGSDEGR